MAPNRLLPCPIRSLVLTLLSLLQRLLANPTSSAHAAHPYVPFRHPPIRPWGLGQLVDPHPWRCNGTLLPHNLYGLLTRLPHNRTCPSRLHATSGDDFALCHHRRPARSVRLLPSLSVISNNMKTEIRRKHASYSASTQRKKFQGVQRHDILGVSEQGWLSSQSVGECVWNFVDYTTDPDGL